MTFHDLCARYLLSLSGRPSADRYRRIYRQVFLPLPWARCAASSITRGHLLWLKQAWESKPSHCRKIIGFVRQVYEWGRNTIDSETFRPIFEGDNPALGIPVPSPHVRERLMVEHELAVFIRGLPLLSPRYQAFFLTRLLAPGRIKELCHARREHISETGHWYKPDTKTGRSHVTYIPTQAMTKLKALEATSPYYFPGVYGRPITEGAVAKVWRQYRSQIGLDDLWLLDFRRTLATYLYRHIEADDLTAKAILNHYDGRPVAVYVRLDYDFLAPIIQGYADWVMGRACQVTPGNHCGNEPHRAYVDVRSQTVIQGSTHG